VADDVEAPCVCGGPIAPDRRDGFCSSWCRGRDAQGLPPKAPPPLRPVAMVPVASGPADTAERAADSAAATVANHRPADRAPADGEEEPKRPSYRQRRRLIADEVEARLRDADLLDTWQAAQVLDLADALDWQGGALSARAAAHRELERQMTELLRGRDEAGSAVGSYRNELAERRAKRAGGAAGG
jgi:hypothetical protein